MIPLAKGRQLLNPAHSGNFHIISRIHLVLTFFWWIQSHLFMWNQLRDLNLLRQFPALHPQVQACFSYCEVWVILKKKQLSYKHKGLNYTLIIKPSYTFSLHSLGGQPWISAAHLASERGRGSRKSPKEVSRALLGARAHIAVPGLPRTRALPAGMSAHGVIRGKEAQAASPEHPKSPFLQKNFLGKDLISPDLRHVPKIDIDSKADDSSFRNACISSLQSLTTGSGQASRAGGNPTFSEGVQAALVHIDISDI